MLAVLILLVIVSGLYVINESNSQDINRIYITKEERIKRIIKATEILDNMKYSDIINETHKRAVRELTKEQLHYFNEFYQTLMMYGCSHAQIDYALKEFVEVVKNDK